MARMRPARWSFILIGIAAFAAAGCGGDAIRVSGRLVKDGKPYTANLDGRQPETFAVDFVGTVNGTRVVFPATLSADGTFTVGGPNGHGIQECPRFLLVSPPFPVSPAPGAESLRRHL